MRRTITRRKLERLWTEATTLADTDCSPLTRAIIDEAQMDGTDNTTEGAYERAMQIAQDCEDFANAIAEWAVLPRSTATTPPERG